MFGEAGRAYVYFVYGNHWCLNFTTEEEGQPGAVLIRALEPVEGVARMARSRGVDDLRSLTSGPGRLTEALSIGGSFNGEDVVTSKRLRVEGRAGQVEAGTSARIGVSSGREMRWRFFVVGNPVVSKGKA